MRPAYDPRDKEQDLRNPGTWKPTDNPALLLADIWRDLGSDVDWTRISNAADMCDEEVPLKKTCERIANRSVLRPLKSMRGGVKIPS